MEIQNDAQIDWKYKEMVKRSRYKSWVLRTEEKGDKQKPKFIGVIGKIENMENEVSKAHLNKLKEIGVNVVLPYKNIDDNDEIFITYYTTGEK